MTSTDSSIVQSATGHADPGGARLGRRSLLAGAGGAAAAAGFAAPAIGQTAHTWRMVTSWPANAPGPGTSANRLARRIGALSGGRLTVQVYGAGELVPAFETFDAVALGNAEMAHTASFFWAGKVPAAPFFTAMPFGLAPHEHDAWLHEGGGQALWDDLYRPHGLKPFAAGNSGMQMGGWLNRAVDGLDDLQGLVYRMPGLGGAALERLGVTTVALPPGEIFAALESGVIDGAEFLGPWSDLAIGLDQAARYYYWPGFHEPNGSAECLVNLAAYQALPADLQELVAVACEAEAFRGLAEANWQNAAALARIRSGDVAVALKRYPDTVLEAVRVATQAVLDEQAAGDAAFRDILDSYRAAQAALKPWSRLTLSPMIASDAA